MTKQMTTLVEGKSIRFAPGRDRGSSLPSTPALEPASSIWKVWAEGSEVYALSRMSGRSVKLSVHESGQIHLRQAAKQKQDLAPQMQIGSGPWMHAFELRFLLSDGALSPFGERESLKNKTAILISVPDGCALYANLIIGPAGSPLDFPLPVEFLGAQTFWRTRLRNGRLAVLLARVLALGDENRGRIKYVREELKLTATFNTMPEKRYAEIYDIHWSPTGGNVILVVALGNEAFRSEHEPLQSDTVPQAIRTFRYQSVRATVELIAPDGKKVAVIELPDVEKQVELVKGQPKVVELGPVTMRIEPCNLIPGSKFIASPCTLTCNPRVGGAGFRDWRNEIHARFDGSCLSAEIRKASGSLQNKNLSTPVSQLDDGEEIVVAIPADEIKLSATLEVPSTSAEFLGRFTLRDRR